MQEPQQPTALVKTCTCSFYLILYRNSYDGKGTLRVRAMYSNRSLKGSAKHTGIANGWRRVKANMLTFKCVLKNTWLSLNIELQDYAAQKQSEFQYPPHQNGSPIT